MHHEAAEEFRDCITQCWDCRNECQTTLFNHCLQEGGKHVEERHVRLMMDCIQICQTAADFMTRSSNLHAEICRACAAVCEACAQSCEEVGDDEIMKRCAEVCRACAESCQEMAAQAGGFTGKQAAEARRA